MKHSPTKLLIASMLIVICLVVFSRLKLHAQNPPIVEIPMTRIHSAAWHPDGSMVAVAHNHGLTLFNDQMTPIQQINLNGDSARAEQAVWSPDGHEIAIVRYSGRIEIWDAQSTRSWRKVKELPTTAHQSRLLKWDHSGRRLATLGENTNEILIWDVETQWISAVVSLDTDQNIVDFEWSPDDDRFAIGIRRNAIMIWDLAAQQSVLTFEEHTDYISDVAWSPDGTMIASSGYWDDCHSFSNGFKVYVWDAESGEIRHTFNTLHCSFQNPLAWSPDGGFLAITNESGSAPFGQWTTWLEVWNIANGEKVNEWKLSDADSIHQIAWQPGGDSRILFRKTVGFRWCGSTAVGIVDTDTSHTVSFQPPDHSSYILALEWSSQGNLLASGGADRNIVVWDAKTGEQKTILSGHECSVQHLAWRPNSTQLASTGDDWAVHIWDTESGENLHTAEFVWSNVIEGQILTWNDTGSRLVTVDYENRGRVWDSELRPLYDFQLPMELLSPASSLTWDGDDPVIARTASSVEIWRISAQPTLELTLPARENGSVKSVHWNVDGTLLATRNEDDSIDIWGADGTLINTLPVQRGIRTMIWHQLPDVLAVVGFDVVFLYTAKTGAQIGQFEVGRNTGSFAWNPDGTLLAGTQDSTIKVWETGLRR